MITVRRAEDRGHANHGWLKTWHTFSFADYHDPDFMGYRALRVINEDIIEPGKGFGTHPHRDMEIITYVMSGAISHKDSMGNGSVIRPGDVQRMTAGTGVTHSEFNPSADEPLHLYQIWILPEVGGLEPSYEQTTFADEGDGALRLLASRDGRDGSVTVHQDIELYRARLAAGREVEHELRPGRGAWVQVARGAVSVNGAELGTSSAAAVEAETSVRLSATDDAEVLLFDLA